MGSTRWVSTGLAVLAQRRNCRSLRDYKVWPPPAKYLERQGIERQRAAFLLCCPAWQANCS